MTVETDALAIPVEGNPWGTCISRTDVLWSPESPDVRNTFARRVVEIQETPDQIVVETTNAGFADLSPRVRVEVGNDDR